jgi:hypothetical protein
MVFKCIFTIFGIFVFFSAILSQGVAMSIDCAKLIGVSIEELDLNYKSALHMDTSKAVFKIESEQGRFQKAYIQLLQDMNAFLSQHNFKWEVKTKCFQRIYFNTTGKIDYFIYNFKLKSVAPEALISDEKVSEFNRLLNLFIKDYVFSIKVKEKMAQCSPTAFQ